MPSASYYRAEAARCRRSATQDQHASASASLLRLATEYDQLAQVFETSERNDAGRRIGFWPCRNLD